MANPNIVSVTSIKGESVGYNLTSTTTTTLVGEIGIQAYQDVDTGSNTSYTSVATGSNTSYSDAA